MTTDSIPSPGSDLHSDLRGRLDSALHRLAVAPSSGSDTLVALRIDSLTLLRIVSSVLDPDADIDLDPASLGSVRTVDQLADWLQSAEDSVGSNAGTAP